MTQAAAAPVEAQRMATRPRSYAAMSNMESSGLVTLTESAEDAAGADDAEMEEEVVGKFLTCSLKHVLEDTPVLSITSLQGIYSEEQISAHCSQACVPSMRLGPKSCACCIALFCKASRSHTGEMDLQDASYMCTSMGAPFRDRRCTCQCRKQHCVRRGSSTPPEQRGAFTLSSQEAKAGAVVISLRASTCCFSS